MFELTKTIINKFILIIFSNKNILLLFTLFFLILSFNIINQYSIVLVNIDYYDYFFGDGSYHIALINNLQNDFTLKKIHTFSNLYNNNYYIFTLLLLNFAKIFFINDYSLIGLSAIILNLISIYLIFIASFLIAYRLSKSKIFSLGITLCVWNFQLINISLKIYPDILQLAFIFIAFYFLIKNEKFNWFFAFLFCGLAFGVKYQGLFIFFYLITLFFFNEVAKNFKKKINFISLNKVFFKVFFLASIFFVTFFTFNNIHPIEILNAINSKIPVNDDIKYNNFKYSFIYLTKIVGGTNNLFICIFLIFSGLIFFNGKNTTKIFFYVNLLFIIFFYISISMITTLVEGPRYLFHMIPLLLISLSLSFKYVTNFLKKKKLNFLTIILSLLFISYSVSNFSINIFNAINLFDFKNKIKNDEVIKAYNYLKKIDEYKNTDTLICAGRYSVVPNDISQNIIKTYIFRQYEKEIINGNCKIIVLDFYNPGRLIWFKDNPKNLDVKEFDDILSPFTKKAGRYKIEKEQKVIKNLLINDSNYKIDFFNSKIVILKHI